MAGKLVKSKMAARQAAVLLERVSRMMSHMLVCSIQQLSTSLLFDLKQMLAELIQ